MLSNGGSEEEEDAELEDGDHGEVLPEDEDNDQVQRNSEEVQSRRAGFFRNVGAAETSHRRPEDSTAHLNESVNIVSKEQWTHFKDQEATENEWETVWSNNRHRKADGGEKENVSHEALGAFVLLEKLEDGRSYHCRNHESGENVAVGNGDGSRGTGQGWGPLENEGVHGTFEERLDESKTENIRVWQEESLEQIEMSFVFCLKTIVNTKFELSQAN